ncbi:hypothetical protein OG21DRAFT_1080111 [Imleria badia]|nr:hypothetical protein OG21DRAFT_1080111 [Imleria badia]
MPDRTSRAARPPRDVEEPTRPAALVAAADADAEVVLDVVVVVVVGVVVVPGVVGVVATVGVVNVGLPVAGVVPYLMVPKPRLSWWTFRERLSLQMWMSQVQWWRGCWTNHRRGSFPSCQ